MLPDDCWLVTERLALRRMTHDDLDWLATLYSDEEVTRYLGGLKTRDQVEDMLRTRVIEYYDTHPGLGMWMTVERASGQGVGFLSLIHISEPTRPY